MKGHPPKDEQQLLQRVIAGHRDALVALYELHSGPVYRFALHMTADRTLAEEITQETFLELLTNNRSYRPDKGPLLPWMLGVARNKYRNARRDLASYESLDGVNAPEIATDHDPLGDFTRKELLQSLQQAITSLPPLLQEVIVLCELEELEYAAAAQVLACPVGTVRSRLHRAKTLLTSKLKSRCLV